MSIDTIRSKNSLDKLLGAVASEKAPLEKKSYTDERIWKGELDKSGNGYAVLRFLPAIHGEELPWVKMYSHAFQGPTGQWYIENSRTTINQKDPVSEYNSKLWNTGLESDKEIARKQKRKLSYYSNVYVVSDPKHPNNEGKVFLFKYGKKIYDKLLAAMQPEFQDETPVNPFDPFVGANFKLKIRKVDGYWNYDKSEFEAPSKLFEDEAKVEEVCGKAYALSEFSQATNFKSYEELQTRMDIVLSGTTKVGNVQESIQKEVRQTDSNPQVEATQPQSMEPTPIIAPKEEDDTMSYFEKLANS
tara:strand:- start:52 stop:957 length:906 start_codon:yes stop_codon:yes gene_type:complete